MRIESTAIQNGSIAIKSVKKRENQDKENNPQPNSESLKLSDTAQLLNKLLHASSNQLRPYPFYFANAAARNIQQACTISKNIKNQAESMGVSLNYTMIYDMVVNLANKKNQNNILWIPTITTEHESLSNAEKALFEQLHIACLQYQTPVSVVENAALEYMQVKQTSAEALPDKRECAQIIINRLKAEPVLNHNNVKKSLSNIIKHYVTPATQAEVT